MRSSPKSKARRKESPAFGRLDPSERAAPVKFVISIPLEILFLPKQVEK